VPTEYRSLRLRALPIILRALPGPSTIVALVGPRPASKMGFPKYFPSMTPSAASKALATGPCVLFSTVPSNRTTRRNPSTAAPVTRLPPSTIGLPKYFPSITPSAASRALATAPWAAPTFLVPNVRLPASTIGLPKYFPSITPSAASRALATAPCAVPAVRLLVSMIGLPKYLPSMTPSAASKALATGPALFSTVPSNLTWR